MQNQGPYDLFICPPRGPRGGFELVLRVDVADDMSNDVAVMASAGHRRLIVLGFRLISDCDKERSWMRYIMSCDL